MAAFVMLHVQWNAARAETGSSLQTQNFCVVPPKADIRELYERRKINTSRVVYSQSITILC